MYFKYADWDKNQFGDIVIAQMIGKQMRSALMPSRRTVLARSSLVEIVLIKAMFTLNKMRVCHRRIQRGLRSND